MNKRYIPSLMIFAKGIMITAIGILFKFTHYPAAIIVLNIGGVLIFASFVVLFVMYLIKPKV